jgi:ABC-2 type transport system permease protein
MFRTVWSKTLRDHRIPLFSWGIGLGFLMLIEFAAYAQQDAASTASIIQLAQSMRFIGDPVALNTLSGFVTWRILDLFAPASLAVWAILAGARMVRGEEERNSLDLLLAIPISRSRLLLEKLLALVLALLLIGILVGIGIIAGQASVKVPIEVGRALLTGLNISLFSLFFAALALCLAQFLRTQRAAAGLAGGLLALSIVIDGTGLTIENGTWLERFSPLYYYANNKPLITTYASHPDDTAILFIGIILLCVLSSILFIRRDTGNVAFPIAAVQSSTTQKNNRNRALEHAQKNIFIRTVGLRSLQAQSGTAFWWLISIIAYTLWVTTLTPSILKPLQDIVKGNPTYAQIFSGQNIATNSGFLGVIIFQIVPLLAVAFIFTQALKWSSDLDAGRFELILGTQKTRTRILSEHFAVVLLFAVLTPFFTWLAVLLGAQLVNVRVDTGHIAAASFSMLPLELLVATAVYICAERLRSSVILTLVTIYLTCAYCLELLRSLVHLPEWLLSLSIFHAYGNPIMDGWNWQSNAIMLGIALVLLLIGIFQFRQSDIQRGN